VSASSYLLGVDLATVRELVSDVEAYIRADTAPVSGASCSLLSVITKLAES
jgi:glycine/serine hydroxymethyltransferase